jgi:hypothetical protein
MVRLPNPIDYARPNRTALRIGLLALLPQGVAVALAVAVLGHWLFFFTFDAMVTIDTHLTNRPQDYPAFQLTPWRPAPPVAGRLTREALCPLTFRTLRYEQISDDGGVTVATEGYHADIRWRPMITGLLLTLPLPAIMYVTLKRLLRQEPPPSSRE